MIDAKFTVHGTCQTCVKFEHTQGEIRTHYWITTLFFRCLCIPYVTVCTAKKTLYLNLKSYKRWQVLQQVPPDRQELPANYIKRVCDVAAKTETERAHINGLKNIPAEFINWLMRNLYKKLYVELRNHLNVLDRLKPTDSVNYAKNLIYDWLKGEISETDVKWLDQRVVHYNFTNQEVEAFYKDRRQTSQTISIFQRERRLKALAEFVIELQEQEKLEKAYVKELDHLERDFLAAKIEESEGQTRAELTMTINNLKAKQFAKDTPVSEDDTIEYLKKFTQNEDAVDVFKEAFQNLMSLKARVENFLNSKKVKVWKDQKLKQLSEELAGVPTDDKKKDLATQFLKMVTDLQIKEDVKLNLTVDTQNVNSKLAREIADLNVSNLNADLTDQIRVILSLEEACKECTLGVRLRRQSDHLKQSINNFSSP